MPDCRKCGIHFPNYAKVDGKPRNVGNRKFCLDCSPWGKHNTRKLDAVAPTSGPDGRLVCTTCDRIYARKKGNGSSLSQCASCRVNGWRIRNKLKAIEYKGGKCSGCGYNKCPAALEFHHVDPDKKEAGISFFRGWLKQKAELDKCILLCANCHRETHFPAGYVWGLSIGGDAVDF
jgi:hypothetical protein